MMIGFVRIALNITDCCTAVTNCIARPGERNRIGWFFNAAVKFVSLSQATIVGNLDPIFVRGVRKYPLAKSCGAQDAVAKGRLGESLRKDLT